MAHSVKIDDKLYEKLRAYCNINGISVTKLCNDAILDYLNTIKFGDTPFLIADKLIDERQAQQEAVVLKADTVDAKGVVYPKEVVEDAVAEFNENLQKSTETPANFDKNTENFVIESVKSDENGNIKVNVKKASTINHITTTLTVKKDGAVGIDEETKETRPKKRRL